MLNRFGSFVSSVRERGLLHLLRVKLDRSWRQFTERREERRLSIDTGGNVQLKDLGITDERFVSYEASRFNHFHRLMRAAGLQNFDGAFLDIGSGKGRAVVLAATYPFRRVIGVEISDQLQSIARQNIERARPKLACKDIELVTCDASAYEIPDDVIAIYFFNPFYPSVLSSYLDEHSRFAAAPAL